MNMRVFALFVCLALVVAAVARADAAFPAKYAYRVQGTKMVDPYYVEDFFYSAPAAFAKQNLTEGDYHIFDCERELQFMRSVRGCRDEFVSVKECKARMAGDGLDGRLRGAAKVGACQGSGDLWALSDGGAAAFCVGVDRDGDRQLLGLFLADQATHTYGPFATVQGWREGAAAGKPPRDYVPCGE